MQQIVYASKRDQNLNARADLDFFFKGSAGVCSLCPRSVVCVGSVVSVGDVFSGSRFLAMLEVRKFLVYGDCSQQEEGDEVLAESVFRTRKRVVVSASES